MDYSGRMTEDPLYERINNAKKKITYYYTRAGDMRVFFHGIVIIC